MVETAMGEHFKNQALEKLLQLKNYIYQQMQFWQMLLNMVHCPIL